MAPTLVASRTALPPEGAAAPAVWLSQSRGPCLKGGVLSRLLIACSSLPPEGAGLAWGGPALAGMAPTLATAFAALSAEGAVLAWDGPALRPLGKVLLG
jgi:hypothetical protein